jgi:hypothetical protein
MQYKGTICRSEKTVERKTGERLNQHSMFNCCNRIHAVSIAVNTYISGLLTHMGTKPIRLNQRKDELLLCDLINT